MTNKLIGLILGVALIVAAYFLFVANQDKQEEQANNNTQIANPAAVYCEEVGGVYSRESGECSFADGSTEDAWIYFRANADVEASGEAESN